MPTLSRSPFCASYMSYYRGKLKGLVFLGSIALALMPCLQQTHALCRLAGCVKSLQVPPANSVALRGAERGRCCGHGSEYPCEKPSQNNRGENAPCGPDCWCAQPPDPCDAPRNVTESVRSRVSTLHVDVPAGIGVEWHSYREGLESLAPDSLPSRSAGETCVRLCRFLT